MIDVKNEVMLCMVLGGSRMGIFTSKQEYELLFSFYSSLQITYCVQGTQQDL